MPFTVRDWVDGEPVTAAKLEDLEARVAAYADSISGAPAKNPFRPAGSLYETFNRVEAANVIAATATLSTGVLALSAINIPTFETITSISYMSGSQALSAGTHQFFGLYDDDQGTSSGTPYALLRGSTDDTSTAWGTTTIKTLNLTSQYVMTRKGGFYLGILIVATTPPNLQGSTATSAAAYAIAPVPGWSTAAGLTALPNPAVFSSAANRSHWAWVN